MSGAAQYWAALHLIDRQIVDADGLPAAKVDDLEFEFPREPGALPVASAVLCGPAALARRFGGRLGSFVETLHQMAFPGAMPRPASVSMGVVKHIGTEIRITVSRKELEVTRAEKWIAEHVISHLPFADSGGGDAAQ